MEGLEVEEKPGGLSFRVRVAPRASRNEIIGAHDGALKVALTAPPVDSAANVALCKLLAKALGISKSSVQITRGHQSRDKTVLITGLAEVRFA